NMSCAVMSLFSLSVCLFVYTCCLYSIVSLVVLFFFFVFANSEASSRLCCSRACRLLEHDERVPSMPVDLGEYEAHQADKVAAAGESDETPVVSTVESQDRSGNGSSG